MKYFVENDDGIVICQTQFLAPAMHAKMLYDMSLDRMGIKTIKTKIKDGTNTVVVGKIKLHKDRTKK